MKIAIVHYWFVAQRGERKSFRNCAIFFPEADIFTLVLDRDSLPPALAGRKITTSFVNACLLPSAGTKTICPSCPLPWNNSICVTTTLSFPVSPALPRRTHLPHAAHLLLPCPMRYVWDMYHEYMAMSGPVKRVLMAPLLHYLRLWDRLSADRVDCSIGQFHKCRHANRKALQTRRRGCVSSCGYGCVLHCG